MATGGERFTRWGLILSAIGMAVGTGNIWRFPRVAAENGGGAFLIAWVLFLFAWAIPLLLIEFALGRTTRKGPAGAIGTLIGDKFNWIGVFVGLVTCFITFYYSVVTGWCFRYFVASLTTTFNADNAEPYWNAFTTHPIEPVVFHALALILCSSIIYRGVVRGIERTNRVLIPALFLLLVVAAARAVLLPGSSMGLNFLFSPDWSDLLDYKVWLAALTQSAWSTGAGWGLVTTYSVYMREKEGFTLTAFTTGFGNNSASILAGIAVMCTVFAALPEDAARQALAAGNEGLTFIWLPQLFSEIPGSQFFLPLFFLALSCAAISSLIAMLELPTRMAMDLGLSRKKAVPTVAAVSFVCGLPSAWSMDFFKNQDWVWGIGLLFSGAFIAFAAIRFGAARFREQLINHEHEKSPVGSWFVVFVRYVIPIEFVALLVWWLYQAATVYDPEGWMMPFNTFSVGTVVFQISVLCIAVIATNRAWMARVRGRAQAD